MLWVCEVHSPEEEPGVWGGEPELGVKWEGNFGKAFPVMCCLSLLYLYLDTILINFETPSINQKMRCLCVYSDWEKQPELDTRIQCRIARPLDLSRSGHHEPSNFLRLKSFTSSPSGLLCKLKLRWDMVRKREVWFSQVEHMMVTLLAIQTNCVRVSFKDLLWGDWATNISRC